MVKFEDFKTENDLITYIEQQTNKKNVVYGLKQVNDKTVGKVNYYGLLIGENLFVALFSDWDEITAKIYIDSNQYLFDFDLKNTALLVESITKKKLGF